MVRLTGSNPVAVISLILVGDGCQIPSLNECGSRRPSSYFILADTPVEYFDMQQVENGGAQHDRKCTLMGL